MSMHPSMSVRRIVSVLLAAFCLAPACAVAAEPGVSVLGYTNPAGMEPDWAASVLGGAPRDHRWVYMPIDWSQIQPNGPGDPTAPGNPGAGIVADIDRRVAAYRSRGIQVMGILSIAPGWSHPSVAGANQPPADPASYATFAAWMASRYRGQIAAWQIWNEPDDNIFWAGGPQPDRYAPLLKAAYTAIKGADPDATVVTGGLVGNDYDFLQALYDRGAKGFFDAVGTHTSTACLTKGPDFYYREPSGRVGRFAFTGYREVHQQMLANGEDKPIFMEIGWSTSTRQCNVNNKTGPAGVSHAQQAAFITQAFKCADAYVKAMAVFSLQDAAAQDTRYDMRMGLTAWDGSRKPGWNALAAAATAGSSADPNCGGKVDVGAPRVSIDVPSQYFSRLVIHGAASDAETKVARIELWVDGKRVAGHNQTGTRYSLDWFGSTKLPYGAHTVELRAYDEALNVATAAATVTRVDPATAPRTVTPKLSFAATHRGGRRIDVVARARAAASGFSEKPRGRWRIFFERRDGKRWKPVSHYTKGISRTARIAYLAKKPGTWRVYARLVVDAPYRNARTPSYVFRLG